MSCRDIGIRKLVFVIIAHLLRTCDELSIEHLNLKLGFPEANMLMES